MIWTENREYKVEYAVCSNCAEVEVKCSCVPVLAAAPHVDYRWQAQKPTDPYTVYEFSWGNSPPGTAELEKELTEQLKKAEQASWRKFWKGE